MKSKTYNLFIHFMKLSLGQLLAVILFCNLSFAHVSNGQKVKSVFDVNFEVSQANVPVELLFERISTQTDYKLAYDKKVLSNKPTVTVNETMLGDVLRSISTQTNLKFRQVNELIAVSLTSDGNVKESVQVEIYDKTLQGQIKDSETGEPLPGASVLVKGTSVGAITDVDGNFILSVPDDATALVISFVGFKTQEILIGNRTNFEIRLEADVSSLDEIVVTALGLEKDKTTLAYAAQNLDNQEFNQSRNGDLGSQLSARVPGLQINQLSTGGLVSSSRIILRGETSLNFNKNQPLIIVDGVPVSSNFDGVGASNQQDDIPTDYGNGFTGINPDDVESVNVLKGATAAALYGSRAANGAIVITTKSGKGDSFSIVVNSGWTFETVSRSWDFQNEFGAGLGGNYINGLGLSYGPRLDGSVQEPIMGSPNMPDAEPLLPYAENTFVDDFFETGISSNNSIAISSSNELGHLRVSYTHQEKTGIIPNTDFEKKAFSVRSGYKLFNDLQVDVVANYIKTDSDNLPVIGYGGQSIGYAGIFWPRNASIDWVKDYWVPGQEFIQQNHVTFFTADNPWLIVNENLNGFDKNRIFGNAKLSYQVTDNLRVFVRAGTDYYNDRRVSRRPRGAAQFRNGMYREQNINFQESNFDFLATYFTDLSGTGNTLDVSIGGNVLLQNGNSLELESRQLTVPDVYNAGNIGDIPRLEETVFEKQVNSLYATAQFGIQEAIFLTVAGRNDWSSTLPVDNNSYFYPSFGASVILSELMTLPDLFDQVKIRSSWAQVGSDTDPFLIQQSFAYGTLPGSVENQALIANNDLKPERTNSFEIGTELNLFQNRLGFEFNYYNNISKDQILQAPVSTTSGFSNRLINAGEIRNNGIELLVNATPLRIGAFTWDVVLNYARNRSEIVELAPGIESFILVDGGVSSGTFTVEARPGGMYGDIYGPVFERSPDNEIVFNNGLPVLAQEVGKVGNINPDWTAGLRNSFSYKRFNLSVLLDYRSGGDVYSGTNSVMYVTGVNTESTVNRGGEITGDGVIANSDGTFRPNDVAVDAQTFYFDGFYGRRNAETNVFDGTYFKVREASLGIDISDWLKSVSFINKASISVFGRNLAIWAKSDALRHFDPEIATHNGGNTIVPGIETAQLPGTRTMGFNVRIEF
ncbi:MAG: SusC/RagA family TonB-linked outer membrane protein [Bacteroidota bacterium]